LILKVKRISYFVSLIMYVSGRPTEYLLPWNISEPDWFLHLPFIFLCFTKFSLEYIHYTGWGVTIPIRLLLYISYIAPLSLPLNPLPVPLKTIARGFFVLFHIAIWNPSIIYLHLNLLHSPPPLPLVSSHTHTHTHCTCFTVLSFVINI
jgi:hypothetical protein